MPTYKYKREDGSTFEIQQSIKEDPLEECPETDQPCERVITGTPMFKFKGSGFHETDYDKEGEPYDEDIMENKSDPDKDTYSYK